MARSLVFILRLAVASHPAQDHRNQYCAHMHSVMAAQTTYSVGWLSLSLINAGLAQGKRRSGLAWWLISLFIGPFATLLIVLLPGLWDRQ